MRESAGLSQREASRRTAPPGASKPAVSAGRWKQLETGWQKNKGVLIPIGTTSTTVAAAARAVGWDLNEALTVAGFDPAQAALSVTNGSASGALLFRVSDDDLLAEVRRRMHVGQRQHQYQSSDDAEARAVLDRLEAHTDPVNVHDSGDRIQQGG